MVAPFALVLAKGRPRALLAFASPLALGVGLSAIYLLPALALERYRDAAVLWSDQLLRPDHWLLVNGIWRRAHRHGADQPQGDRRRRAAGRVHGAALALALGRLCDRLLPGRRRPPPLLLEPAADPVGPVPVPRLALRRVRPRHRDRAGAARRRGSRRCSPPPALALSATFLLAPAPPGPPVTLALLAERHPDVPENLPPGPRPYSWPSRWALDLAARHRAPARQGEVTIEPLFYFPAWRVTCAGQTVETFPRSRHRPARAPRDGLHDGAGLDLGGEGRRRDQPARPVAACLAFSAPRPQGRAMLSLPFIREQSGRRPQGDRRQECRARSRRSARARRRGAGAEDAGRRPSGRAQRDQRRL